MSTVSIWARYNARGIGGGGYKTDNERDHKRTEENGRETKKEVVGVVEQYENCWRVRGRCVTTVFRTRVNDPERLKVGANKLAHTYTTDVAELYETLEYYGNLFSNLYDTNKFSVPYFDVFLA